MFETECGVILRAGDRHAVSPKQKIAKCHPLSPIVIGVGDPVIFRLRDSQFVCLLSARDVVCITYNIMGRRNGPTCDILNRRTPEKSKSKWGVNINMNFGQIVYTIALRNSVVPTRSV